MGVKKSHKVESLDPEHALCLFKENVGHETMNSHPSIDSDLAPKVVEELGGLPLALITIGASMHGKTDPREWDYTIELLKKSRLNEIEATREEEKFCPSSFIGNNRNRDTLQSLCLSAESVNTVVIKGDSQNPYCPIQSLFVGMNMLEEIIFQNLAPKDLFVRFESLEMLNCKLKDVSWTIYLPCLQYLKLNTCRNIIQLFEHFNSASATEEIVEMVHPSFPSLKTLTLHGLSNPQTIYDHSIVFAALEMIDIEVCPKLKKLPSDTVPSTLTCVDMERKCWERLEWEDNDLKQILQPLAKLYPNTSTHS